MKKIKQLPTLREKSLLDENLADFSLCDIMMPGSKGLCPHELAREFDS